MARGRKPSVRWWDRDGGGYFCTLHGRKICLIHGPDDAPSGPTFLAALKRFASLMCGNEAIGTDRLAIGAVLERYRGYLTGKGRASTLSNVTSLLRSFEELHGTKAVGEVKPFHVRDWLDGQTQWQGSTGALAVRLLGTALNWAVKDGIITSNPLLGRLERPKETLRGREARISKELQNLIIDACQPVPGKKRAFLAFGLLCRMWQGTGCRPEEIEQAQAFNYEGGCIIYRPNATRGYIHKQAVRGAKKDRVICLTPELDELVREQIKKHPSGPIFPTTQGKPWLGQTRAITWKRVLNRPKVKEYIEDNKLNKKKIVPYSFRHSFISEWLDSGRSIKVVADLCGTSVNIIEKYYGHPDTSSLKTMFLSFAGER